MLGFISLISASNPELKVRATLLNSVTHASLSDVPCKVICDGKQPNGGKPRTAIFRPPRL
jgi:hypothetical protein